MSRTVRKSARPLLALIPLVALLGATLDGCASQSAAPVVSFPSESAPPPLDLDATPEATSTGPSVADSVSAQISDPTGAPVGSYQDGWTSFSVVVSNSSAADVPNVVPLVVFGSCTCDPSSGGVPPRSILQVYDTTTGTWAAAASVSVDASGKYTFEHQVPQETLAAHKDLTFQYRVTLSGSALTGMRDGVGSIEVYVMQQPGHKRITDAPGPDASLSLAYDAG
jgi:hypothetical protein